MGSNGRNICQNASQPVSRRSGGDNEFVEEDEYMTDVLEDTKWLEKEVGDRTRAKFELKKAIKIGGECISVIGSACLYRALLERCWARKMAMICRFCSRANQKVRLVALIPQMSGKSENRSDTIREYNFDGFHVVFLPFAEDIRDVSEKMKCPQGDWPKRLQSFYAMIVENVVGEQIVKPTDTLLPYHARPEWAQRVKKESAQLIQHFHLDQLEQLSQSTGRKRAGDSTSEGGRAKTAKADVDARELAEKGKLDSLTVAQLRAAIEEHMACTIKSGTKKAELVSMLKKYFGV
ncbi:hypothetical protein TELCIR_00720 [Teladorsagia circumcincta]|uniref:Ku domain-containing protein n=1 Tax=Teladorsagia circumcincta TaxID=45464 RepID=A0A2G9V3X2_TELCI|nr:hypothetical protein TELCIR_00720 [Teladorsagia circumcincta]